MDLSEQELRITIQILTRSNSYSSIRNEFFKYFRSKKNLTYKACYKRVYHLVLEISKKRNWIDEIIRFQNINVKLFTKQPNRFLAALRVITFIFFIEEYSLERPQKDYYIKFISKFFSNEDSQTHTKILEEFLTLMNFKIDFWEKENTDNVQQLSMKFFHPKWLITYLQNFWEEKNIEEFLNKNNSNKETSFRILTDKYNSNQKYSSIIEQLRKDDISVEQHSIFKDVFSVSKIGKIPLTQSKANKEKKIIIQSSISSIISHLLDPQDDELILDMAAAPGMKSSHIMTLMGKKSHLISVDISKRRIEQLFSICSKLSGNSHSVLLADAGLNSYLPLKSAIFDRILLDAPCSSTGIMWKYPDHRWHSKEKIQEYTFIQRNLFKELLRLIKPGGIGFYSVCSIHYLEGESIIESFLPQIDLIEVPYGREKSCFPCTEEEINFSPDILKNCRRTFSHTDNTDCFFMAKFRKPK